MKKVSSILFPLAIGSAFLFLLIAWIVAFGGDLSIQLAGTAVGLAVVLVICRWFRVVRRNTEPINIISYAEGPERLLSNFAHTPFELDGIHFESVEGFLQGLKVEGPEKQLRIFGKHGFQAKRAGTKARNQNVWTQKTVWLQGTPIAFPSDQYDSLVERAIRAKFEQNKDAREALVATGDRPLIHDTGRPESPRTSLPAVRFLQILTRLRAELRSTT